MSKTSDTPKATELALQFAANRGLHSDRASFLEAVVVFLTKTLGVKYAFVARCDENNSKMVRTVALAEKGTVLSNASYPLAGSPCADVMKESVCEVASCAQEKYPEDTMLVDMGVQAYVGVVLPSSSGTPAGHIAIMHCQALAETGSAAQVLSILSSSVAWELERGDQETRLKSNEQRFRDFAEASSDWYWETDKDHRFTYISPKVFETTGIPAEKYFGKTRWELSEVVTNSWQDHIDTLNRHEAFKNLEYQASGANGDSQFLRVSGVPVFDQEGEFVGYRGTSQEITDQKNLQIALEESEARYEQATQQVSIWDKDLVTDDLFVASRFIEMLGYTEAEFKQITNGTLEPLVHPDDLAGWQDRRKTALNYPNHLYENEFRLRHKSGSYRWFESRGKVLTGDDEVRTRASGVFIDITDRKEMEQSLSEATERAVRAERRLLSAINAIQDSFAIYDADNRLVMFNEKYKEDRPLIAELLKPGAKFEDLFYENTTRGGYPEAIGREEEWYQKRLKAHLTNHDGEEYKLSDGRWMRVTDRKTPDGDTVRSRVDVTLFKQGQEIAESANKAKSEFLSSMSHELRTPLNAILGFGQLLKNDSKNPISEAQQRAVKHILNSGSHLLTLIDEVLDLAKIESGQERMSIEQTEISDVIASSLSLVQTTADQHQIEIKNQIDIEHATVLADYTRLKQVIVNLLTNAVKYNTEGGSVTLSAEKLEDTIRLKIADTGPGISPDRFEELFQPFMRLGAETTEIEGTGIGLTISKKLIELMDGTIGVDSAIGEGSVFWLDLPMAAVQEIQTVADQAQAIDFSIGDRPINSDNLEGSPFTVMYVEDNPTNIRLMEQILDLVSDAELTSTHTAENALEMVGSVNPDLILMDINLPGMNGIQALNRLRASPDTSSVPVIAISADAIPESIQRGLEAGFHSYLTKPIRVDEILDIIDSIRA